MNRMQFDHEERAIAWIGIHPVIHLACLAYPCVIAYSAFRSATLAGVVVGTVLLFWWISGVLVWTGQKAWLWITTILTAAMWFLVCIRLKQHLQAWWTGKLERSDGMGSPMAFWIGWAWETVVLTIPITLLMAVCLAHLWMRRYEQSGT